MRAYLRPPAASAYLAACIIFGGSSAAGHIANAALQALAILILAYFAVRARRDDWTGPARPLLLFGFAFLLLAALQAIPLPPALWTNLPGREVVAQGFARLDLTLPWLSLSLRPDATIAGALSILPPLALAALLADIPMPSKSLPVFIALLGIVAMLIGVAQQAGGPASPLYFYAFTNFGSPVGFFANANHQATLLLMTLPFIAVLAASTLRGGRISQSDNIAKLVILGLLFALIVGAVTLSGSRMGVALLPPAVLFCIGMVIVDVRGKMSRLWLASLAIMIVAGGAGLAASGSILKQELSTSPDQAGSPRGVIWQRTAKIIPDVMPVGSGLGSFVPLYRMREPPEARTRVYANHAHNDYLEWILETGIAGATLLLAFLFWWGRKAVAVWRRPSASLGRAGSVATSLLMLHSLVDYPVRTAAIAALAVVACLFMARSGEKSGA